MADDASGAKKAPTVLRIKLRYDDLDTFVERFAPNIGRAGLFIRTRTPKTVGSEIRFELRLADDKPVVVGLGIVRWVKDYDPRRPRAVHGMGVEFTRVTRESREVLLRVIEHRKRLGLVDGERGLPIPPDDDDAIPQRAGADHSAPVEAPMINSGPVMVTAPVRVPVPVPVPEVPLPEPVAEPSPVAAPSSLAPEPPRRPRRSLESLVAAAPPPTSADVDDDALLAFLGDGLDVQATIARARAVAGADADAELDALLAADAAPVEITVSDASARLADLLGMPAIVPRRRNLAEGTREDNPVIRSAPRPEPEASTEPEPAPAPPPAAVAAPNAEATAAAAAEPTPEPATDDDAEGVTHPVDPDLLTLAAATAVADATPITAPIDKLDKLDPELDGATIIVAPPPETSADTTGDFADPERTAIADPALLAIAAAASARDHDDDDDSVDGPTIAVIAPPPVAPIATGKPTTSPPPFEDDGKTALRPRDAVALRPPPKGEFDGEGDIDTLVKPGEAKHLPPPPSRGKPRTVPPPPPHAPQASSPAIDVAAARENSSGSIDITGLVEQLEAEIAQPQPLRGRERDELDLAAQAMNPDELLDGMRDIGRRRPPSGPAPDLASFADPPEAHGPPRGRPQRGTTADDALAALESLSFDEPGEETAVPRARDLAARPPVRQPTPRPARAPTPPPKQTDDDPDSISIDIDIEIDE